MRQWGKIALLVGLSLAPATAFAQSPVLLYQNSINANILPQGRGAISASVLNQVLNSGASVFATMGTWDQNGNYSPFIPPSTVGLVTAVPQRVATGGLAQVQASDFFLCLNGPVEVDLEPSPAPSRTIVLKDCRAGSGNSPILVVPQGGLTIDRGPGYTMNSQSQSITLTLTTLGWSIY